MSTDLYKKKRIELLLSRLRKRTSVRSGVFFGKLSGLGMFSGLFLCLLLAGCLFWLGIEYYNLTINLPPIEKLPTLLDSSRGSLIQPTQFFDRNDNQVIYTLENSGIKPRYLSPDPLDPNHFSPLLVYAVIELYEPDFWNSPGFSLEHLLSSQPQTIAERLVDQFVLYREENGIARSLRMRILAARVVSTFGRTITMEWFLNNAYFGHLAYGADDAAQLYLGKSAADLDLSEAALLLGIFEAPALNPVDVPIAADELKQAILDRLKNSGKINEIEYWQASSTHIKLAPKNDNNPGVAPGFIRLVLQQLSRQFTRQEIEHAGMKVVTTLDLPLQAQVDCVLLVQLSRMNGNKEGKTTKNCSASTSLPALPTSEKGFLASLSGSVLVENPKTGEILAFTGDIKRSGGSESISPHQPGSLLTPFVAVASFSRGKSPASLVWDIPFTSDGEEITQLNHGRASNGPVRLRTALANDFLLPIERILREIGVQAVWQLVEPMGISLLNQDNKSGSLIYSGGGITLPEIAAAYSVLANQGDMIGLPLGEDQPLEPGTVIKVSLLSDPGKSFSSSTLSRPVLSSQLAYLVHDVLSDQAARQSSLGNPNPLEIGRPAGVKFGQVQDKTEAWVAGYTPQRLVIVWTGLPPGEKTDKTLGVKGVGGIWNAVISYANQDLPPLTWAEPPGIAHIQVCDPSGLLPTRYCPSIVDDIFINGNEPYSNDNLYQSFQVNRETGRLATVFTPVEMVEDRVFFVPPPEAIKWARESKLALAPREYDTIQTEPVSQDARISSPAAYNYVHGIISILGTASGENFKNYRLLSGQGLNPRSWIQIGGEGVAPVINGNIGTWDTHQQPDGLYALRLVITRADKTILSVVHQVTVDNTPPVVRVLYPTAGQNFKARENPQINFLVEASDQSGIERVEWYLNGKLLADNRQTPYMLSWGTQPGAHNLVIIVYDTSGNKISTTPIDFIVE